MATIHDVARVAGVSTSTVSYVLSGKRSISASTKARVERAIKELGYRPHAGARALASSRTNVLGLVVPLREDVNVAVIMEFVRAVVTRARHHDYDVLVLTKDEPTGLERVTIGSVVDAIIVMDIEAEDPRIPALARIDRPVVLIGVPHDPRGLSCVDFDFHAASRLAVRRLAELGHREIALIGSPAVSLQRHATYADRVLEGFTRTAEELGLGYVTHPCGTTLPSVRTCLEAIRADLPGVSGLVVHNEAALPSLLAACAAREIEIPRDLSVIAIGTADAARHLPHPLSSVDIPALEIGRVAVDMVLARLIAPEPAETRLLAPSVNDRGSTAPPENVLLPAGGPEEMMIRAAVEGLHPLTAPSSTPVVK